MEPLVALKSKMVGSEPSLECAAMRVPSGEKATPVSATFYDKNTAWDQTGVTKYDAE